MAKNTIKVKSYSNIQDQKVATAVAITPGMLLERTSGDLVQAHSTAGGPCFPMFALEDAYQGKKITDNYAVSVPIHCWIPTRGDIVYAILDDASSVSAVTIGAFVESAGDGRLRILTPAQSSVSVAEFAANVVGRALEAQSTAAGRFLIEAY